MGGTGREVWLQPGGTVEPTVNGFPSAQTQNVNLIGGNGALCLSTFLRCTVVVVHLAQFVTKRGFVNGKRRGPYSEL